MSIATALTGDPGTPGSPSGPEMPWKVENNNTIILYNAKMREFYVKVTNICVNVPPVYDSALLTLCSVACCEHPHDN